VLTGLTALDDAAVECVGLTVTSITEIDICFWRYVAVWWAALLSRLGARFEAAVPVGSAAPPAGKSEAGGQGEKHDEKRCRSIIHTLC